MLRFALLFTFALGSVARAAGDNDLVNPANRLTSDNPAWRDVVDAFARKPDVTADFSEQRFFPFRKTPLELKGESRVSTSHGLSLHYTAPEEHTVVLDDQGVFVRQAGRDSAAPTDPRASGANVALVQVLRFDLPALTVNFEIFGRRDGTGWTLALVPRAAELRHAVSEIVVAGDAAEVHRIAIRHTPRQYVEILIGPARPTPFTAGELKQYFR